MSIELLRKTASGGAITGRISTAWAKGWLRNPNNCLQVAMWKFVCFTYKKRAHSSRGIRDRKRENRNVSIARLIGKGVYAAF
jgi:hypothetical protein